MSGTHFRTVFISDLHLGTPDSQADAVTAFLRGITCERLVLNGDVIDAWSLGRSGFWKDSHTRCLRAMLDKMEQEDTEIVYLRGNHDDFLERFLPLHLGRLRIVDEYLHETPEGTYLVVHGDGFDSQVTSGFASAVAGSVAYELLLRFNRLLAKWRKWRGVGYFSLSRVLKTRVSSAVKHIQRYERQLAALAEGRGCAGVICGHIHQPNDKRIGPVHYLNSGDWVDSLSAIVESAPGVFRVVRFQFEGEEGSSQAVLETWGDSEGEAGLEPGGAAGAKARRVARRVA